MLRLAGVLSEESGLYGQAQELHERGLALYWQPGGKQGLAASLTSLGTLACRALASSATRTRFFGRLSRVLAPTATVRRRGETMSRSGALETKRAKLMVAVVTLVLLAAFQVALQAKPARAWEMKVTITGAGTVEETTPADLLNCSTSLNPPTPTGQIGATCLAGTPSGAYGNLWDVDYLATPASGYTFQRWESDGSTRRATICDRSSPAATTATYSGSNTCKFRAVDNMQTRVVFADTTLPATPTINSTSPTSNIVNGSKSFNFSIPSDPTFKEFQCRVTPTVQTAFQACTSGVSFNPTADGSYTFEVRSVDRSENSSFTPA